jgi:PAS domain S-box-containing protein
MGLGLGILYWILESVLHTFLFQRCRFVECLFPSDSNEIWMRLFVVGLLAAFATYAHFVFTARKRTEKTLQDSENLVRLITDNVPVLIAYVDNHQQYRFANKAYEEWYGIPPADVLGKHVTAIVGADAYRVLRPYIENALAGRETTFEALVPYQYGGTRHISVKYIPHANEQGDVLGFFALAEDITERKRLEDRLSRSQKMEALGTLAGGIAHEFNNILGVILGFTDLTQHEMPAHSVAWKNLQEVLKASRRAKELVQQILTFSSQYVYKREPLQFSQLVKEALTPLCASLPATIKLQLHIDEDVGTILAEKTQVHQIIQNLFANAEHAMRETGGRLEISVSKVEVDQVFAASHHGLLPGPYVRLTVRDTGHGIAPEIVGRVFDPFFTTKGVGEGTGMGLAIVHGIIASHGGAITVESRVGEGTTFDVYLPRIDKTSKNRACSD